MVNLSNIKTIFFDYDGTIHNSIKVYEPAFIKAYSYLVEEGYAPSKEWTTDEIKYWLGFSSKEMWKEFLPQLSIDIKQKASSIIKNEMEKQVLEYKMAELYDGAIDVLTYLKQKGYTLVFISNCGLNYMENNTKLFQLDLYFDHMICSEQHDFIAKHEILKKVLPQFPMDRVIIGDRIHDIESGVKNNIYTIGCNYGYGSKEELIQSDVIIEDITQLKQYL